MEARTRSVSVRLSLWKQRGRRFATGLNVLAAIALMAMLVAMVDYLSYRHYWRFDIGGRGYFTLSPKTKQLLGSLNSDLNVVVFFQRSHRQHDDVKFLLKEYQYEVDTQKKIKMNVTFVDPDRDLVKAKELGQKYDVKSAGVIVFESAGRRRYVSARDIVEYEYLQVTDNKFQQKLSGFRGENAFSSAIQSVSQSSKPVAYFLAGHGEHDIKDFGAQTGYSAIAKALMRDNIEVRPLVLVEQHEVPPDCSVLIVAGPKRKIPRPEVDAISKYLLERNGRGLFLLDASISTGVEKLLEGWGIAVGNGVVAGLTWSGRDLFIFKYGDHPAAKNLGGLATVFYSPRNIEPIEGYSSRDDGQSDKPRVTPLAMSGDQSWVDMDTSPDTQPRFDPGVDKAGPAPVAVASEKGRVSGLNLELKSTRVAVIGDSYFVSNPVLAINEGNTGFFLSVVNWLVEREALMAIPPKTPGELQLNMTRRQMRLAFALVVFSVPGLAALLGIVVWVRRRK